MRAAAQPASRHPEEHPLAIHAPTLDPARLPALVEPLTALVAHAARAILAVERSAMAATAKADDTPVTRADMASHDVLVAGVAALMPGTPVVSEEDAAARHGPISGSFVLIDPLDGTREYISGSDEYAVNLALISDGIPLLGIVAGPARQTIWRGLVGAGAERLRLAADGAIAERLPIRTRALPADRWVAVVSRSHGDRATEAFIDARPGAVRDPMGSALKFCRVAEGSADIYPRLGPTSEWDVAAGHALIAAAGGKVTDGGGRPLRYGQQAHGFGLPDFIAWGDAAAGL
ncbi:MAG: 3'(2'),5'-bisphosphate nucleotidase CysQ [Xanthobacteraceae bacterium]|nr:MAG: 3'(2'),5'-bisphosphate nucleotidase CysQ [Xanthobacteraceae bacterium]